MLFGSDIAALTQHADFSFANGPVGADVYLADGALTDGTCNTAVSAELGDFIAAALVCASSVMIAQVEILSDKKVTPSAIGYQGDAANVMIRVAVPETVN